MKKISGFDSRSDLFFFLMDTLSHVMYNGYYYCFCREGLQIICSICKVSENFVDFEDEIKKNYFEYLKKYHGKLFPCLMKIFILKNNTICCSLHQEYQSRE